MSNRPLKDTNIIRTPEVAIDPQNFIPVDVMGVRPATPEELLSSDPTDNDAPATADDADLTDVPATDGTDSSSSPPDPEVPSTLTIISQTSRITADGTTVVDVVLEVQDVPGATNYQLRVTTA